MTWLTNPFRFGGATGNHPFWRIVSVGLDSGDAAVRTHNALAEIELALTTSGSNIAASATWTASSTQPTFNISAINDGVVSVGNAHAHNTASSEWWRAQFASPQAIREVRLFPRLTFLTQSPTVVSVQGSNDGTTWFTYALWRASLPWTTSSQAIPVSATPLLTGRANALLWGLDITESNNATNVGFAELEFATSSGGADLCTGGRGWHQRALDSSTFIGRQLFDDNNTTTWNAPWLSTYDTCRVGYLFATPPNPTHCRVRARPSFTGDSPKTFAIVWSNDGITWNTTDTITGATGWANSEVRTYAIS